jgi:S-phase kinase-associated protein 1
MISIRSQDGEVFQVPRATALMSNTVRNVIEDVDEAGDVPVSVKSGTLAKVLEYCNFRSHADETVDHLGNAKQPATPAQVDSFNSVFMGEMSTDELFRVILAANLLDIPCLLDLGCKRVADMIRGKSTEQIRKTFGIVNDFTEEEEHEIRRENVWAFE